MIEDLTLDNLGDAGANTNILRGGRQENQRWLDQAESKGASMDSRRRQRKKLYDEGYEPRYRIWLLEIGKYKEINSSLWTPGGVQVLGPDCQSQLLSCYG